MHLKLQTVFRGSAGEMRASIIVHPQRPRDAGNGVCLAHPSWSLRPVLDRRRLFSKEIYRFRQVSSGIEHDSEAEVV